MISANRWLALSVVSVVLLSGCGARTILHGKRTTGAQKRLAKVNRNVAVWFVKSNDGEPKLVSVPRKLNGKDRLQLAVQELLEGPSEHEEAVGYGTEIPRGTILIGVTDHGKSAELNLSRRFASGGGASSFETRLEQLRRTVAAASELPVYLNIEGKRLTISEGEGIEIRQPINR